MEKVYLKSDFFLLTLLKSNSWIGSLIERGCESILSEYEKKVFFMDDTNAVIDLKNSLAGIG